MLAEQASKQIRAPSLAVPWGALEVGAASMSPPGGPDEDFAGVASIGAEALAAHGLVVVVADGIGGDGQGRHAARLAVEMLLADYYGTQPGWPPAKSLDRVLRACNDWLHAENLRRRDLDGWLASLSAIVFRGAQFFLAHVGDTRAYRVRDGVCKQLTADHVWPRHDMRHIPKRAMGLDSHIVIDYAEGQLRPGDTYALMTDGVWEVLGDRVVADCLSSRGEPQRAADHLVASSLARQSAYMGRNDATAVVAHVASPQ